ncbi:nucleoside recognition domain-containing protein [Ferrimonas sp. YFM]|uniref:nucleoside recognition domain-containing protein n=1 Tax=Ferrimonas sp. YFM TaxID=3028878 RepID=UPI0025726910|nr:nucleoside recognition domain-containing protein [Ferrimonas sp. YFM]BDY05050.1 membrane protein [Ferrimonas sp. YFM]
MLNRLWLALFFLGGAGGLWQWLMLGNDQVLPQMIASLFDMATLSVEILIGLLGVLALWLGLMRIGEQTGLIQALSRLLTPLFSRLMPEVPAGHPALGSVTLNLAANALGLDNAATPMGLKAMKDLQSLNPNPSVATNAQILFLVLNTSSVTLLPVTVFMYRAQQGAAHPTDVFIPILLATCASTLAGLLAVSLVQRINLLDRVVLLWGGGLIAGLLALVAYLMTLSADGLQQFSTQSSALVLFAVVMSFLGLAWYRGVNAYDAFVSGAGEGVKLVVTLLPYLLAMLLAIGWLRGSGALEALLDAIRALCGALGVDARFVDALPTAMMKPLSGSGARAMMVETMNHHGADSFAGRLAAMFQGSTETTFYVLAVYFGSVGIRNGRHAVVCGLTADLAGILTAIAVAYLFYG